MLRLRRLPETHCHLAELLLAASFGRMNMRSEATAVLAEIRASHPNFERRFLTDMNALRLNPELISSLADGLRLAGASIVQQPLASVGS